MAKPPLPLAAALFVALATPALAAEPGVTASDLELVCRQLTAGDAPYFGRAPAEELAARAEGSSSISGVLTRIQLGFELIRLGRLDESIATLEEALALGREVGISAGGSLELAALSNLAMAHFQLAEDQNCLAFHTPDSCILPVRRGAVHRRPEEIRAALDIYSRLLQAQPGNPGWRWLLNLAAMLAGDYPGAVDQSLRLPDDSPALAAGAAFPRWRDVAPALGVDSFDHGGGAIIDDFDDDGLLDIVSSSWDPCEPLRAFRNRGDGGFEDMTESWGLAGQLGSINVVQGDYDGDGDLDLAAFRGAWLGRDGRIRNSLLENRLGTDEGRFVDVTATAGLAEPAYPSHSGAWADYDNDGDLDLYIGNEASASTVDPLSLYGSTGTAFPSQLFRNNGDGTFTDVATTAGVTNSSYAKGVTWGDYDDDGDPDLYVSNIGANRLYRNRGDGTFEDVAAAAGVRAPEDGSFATWFFDHDNDGDLDLFVARYNTKPAVIFDSYFGRPADRDPGHPVLYRNQGGSFQDVSRAAGFTQPALVMGANHGDLDGDGWPDLYLGTGVPDYEALMPNLMYRNVAGRRFEDVTSAGGFGHLQKGHGVAFGDLDNDGDLDLYQQLGGAFPYDAYGNALYLNPSTAGRWLTLRLAGGRGNRFAVGARIEVVVREGESTRSIHHLVGSGGSFGSSSLQAEIGLGAASSIESVHIRWPGTTEAVSLRGAELDAAFLAVEGETELRPLELHRFEIVPEGDVRGHDH